MATATAEITDTLVSPPPRVEVEFTPPVPLDLIPAPAPAPGSNPAPAGTIEIKYTPDMLAYENLVIDTATCKDYGNLARNFLTTGGYQIRASAQITIPIAQLHTYDLSDTTYVSNATTQSLYYQPVNGQLAQINPTQSAAIGGINIANNSHNQLTISNLSVQGGQILLTLHTNSAWSGAAGTGTFVIGSGTAGWNVANWNSWPAKSKEELLRDKIKQQLNAPIYAIRNGQKILVKDKDLWDVKLTPEENKARGLLREMIGDEAFKRYLKRGFIMVQGNSGVRYKIHGGDSSAKCRGLIESYIKNPVTGTFTPFEAFCIQFRDAGLPHTDGVIMRKMLVENDEFGMRKLANVRSINPNNQQSVFNKQGDLVIAGTPYVIPQPQRVAV